MTHFKEVNQPMNLQYVMDILAHEASQRFNTWRFDFKNVQILYSMPSNLIPLLKWVLHEFNSYISYGRGDMPMTIGIETISVCDRHCRYCPVSLPSFNNSRNLRVMTDEVYASIIEQLTTLPRKGGNRGFNGVLSLNAYGEPLLDNKIIERVEQARSRLPEAKVGFFSNGDFLTKEKLDKLVSAGVQEVVLTPHDGQFKPPIYDLAEYEKRQANIEKRKPVLRLKEPLWYLCNRGGDIQGIAVDQMIYPQKRCISPSYAFWISSDGIVAMCCNDAQLTHPMGDITQFGIMEIWDSEKYRDLRAALRHGKWEELPKICTACRTPSAQLPT